MKIKTNDTSPVEWGKLVLHAQPEHAVFGNMTLEKLKGGVVFETPYFDMFITKEEVAKLVDELQAWLISQ